MSLPPGYSSPAYTNTPEDRGGWAVVASGVALVFILLFASLRLYTRYPFRSRLLYDDLAIIVSTAAAIIQSCLVIAAVSQGLGKTSTIIEPRLAHPTEKVRISGSITMPNKRLTVTTKLLYSSDLFYVVGTFSSRTAVLCLLYALSPERWHKLVTKSGMIVSILTAVAAVLMVAFGCDAGSPWTQISQECNSVVSHSFVTSRSYDSDRVIAVFAMDCRCRAQHLAGAFHDRHHPTDAVYATNALDRQAQGDRGVRIETPVSTSPRTHTGLS
jgi:hypothetical protein